MVTQLSDGTYQVFGILLYKNQRCFFLKDYEHNNCIIDYRESIYKRMLPWNISLKTKFKVISVNGSKKINIILRGIL
ncbi:MAG: hypothetical protein ABIG10_02165 [bacterium]